MTISSRKFDSKIVTPPDYARVSQQQTPMIGYLSGTVKLKETDSIVLDVNGVGYLVRTPLSVWQDCRIGDKKELLIYTHVRDEEISLYGFTDPLDKKTFLNLISVSGVGPKIGLNILSQAQGAQNIIKAIQEADVEFFTSIKGLGKKISQRIIVDLKPKIGGIKDLEFEAEPDADLTEGLKGLGFSREEIKKAVKGIGKELPLEEKLKLALKKNQ